MLKLTRPSIRPSKDKLWDAYKLAPIFGPLTFVPLLWMFVAFCYLIGDGFDCPAFVLFYSAGAIFPGLPFVYIVALILWMPAMHWLVRNDCYCRDTVWAAAAVLAMLLTIFSAVFVSVAADSEFFLTSDGLTFLTTAHLHFQWPCLVCAQIFYFLSEDEKAAPQEA